jgi:hypothetical protein
MLKFEFLKQFHAKHDKFKLFIIIHKMSKWFMIHAMLDEQDMCKMGGLASLLHFTYGLVVKTLVCLHKFLGLILDGCKL